MEAIDIAERILSLIDELGEAKKQVRARATSKAANKSAYDKALALTIIKLKNGVITEFEDQKIESLAVTVMESVARGICWKERYEMELSESLYKSALSYVDVTTTQIQGLQSIYKHLDTA